MTHNSTPSIPNTFGASDKEIIRVTAELENSTKKELVTMISRGTNSQEITSLQVTNL